MRWWDHRLKDRLTGIMDEPMLRVWMQESVAPQTNYETRPGRWVGKTGWPAPGATVRELHLGPHRLMEETGEAMDLSVSPPQTTGLAGGEWCAFRAEGELLGDQRIDTAVLWSSIASLWMQS